MAEPGMCRIPVAATFEKINGEMVMVSAEYEDVPAMALAEFFIDAFRRGAVHWGGEENK